MKFSDPKDVFPQIPCNAFNSRVTVAEFVGKYFTKEMQVAVVGRLQTRTWDASEGKRHCDSINLDKKNFQL